MKTPLSVLLIRLGAFFYLGLAVIFFVSMRRLGFLLSGMLVVLASEAWAQRILKRPQTPGDPTP